MAPGDDLGDGSCFALELGRDTSVGLIAHPASDSQSRGFAPRRIAERHTLDAPVNGHANADGFRRLGSHGG